MDREITRVERLFGVRPEEERDAFAAFAVLFGLMAAHTMLETARDALFLAHLSPNELPGVYLATAFAGLVLTIIDRKLANRASSIVAIGGFVAIGAIATGGLAFTDLRSAPVLYALYLWSNVFASWAMLQFSLVTSSRFDVAQAKRVLGFVGAGAIVGAVFGAALGRGLLELFPTRALLVASAILFLLTAVGPLAMLAKRERAAPVKAPARKLTEDAMRGAEAIAKVSYARLLLLLLVASSIALTIGDFVFKRYASSHYSHELASFFADVQVGVNLLALVVQLALVPWLLRTLGPHLGLLLLPVLLAVGGVSMLASAGLFGALLLRGSDGTLRYSLHKTSVDLLYFPLSDVDRRRIKPIVDTIGSRGGQALGAVLLLFLDRTTKGPMLTALLASIGVWMGSVFLLRPPYVRLFRESLKRGAQAFPTEIRLDLRGLESTVAALSSGRDTEVNVAIDLLAGHREGALVPILALYHPSPTVVIHTLERLTEMHRTDATPAIDALLSHADSNVRAAAVRARAQLAADETVLRKLLEDPRPEVAATALVALVAHGWVATEELREAIDRLRGSAVPEVRLAVARAVIAQPAPNLVPALQACAETDSPEVIAATVEAMALVPDESFLPHLIPLLQASKHRELARRALVAIGEPALEQLTRLLNDTKTPHVLRRHVPETVRRFEPQLALPVLVERFAKERDGMVKFKILRSLNRLRALDSTLPIPRDVIVKELEATLTSAFRLAHTRLVLQRGDRERAARSSAAEELLVDVLHDKRMHAAERAVRLVNILLPNEDFGPLMRNYTAEAARRKANVLEVLGATIPARYRSALLALLEGNDDPLGAAEPFYVPRAMTYEKALETLMKTAGTTLASLAAYHAAELGLPVVVEAPPSERPSAKVLDELVRGLAAAPT